MIALFNVILALVVSLVTIFQFSLSLVTSQIIGFLPEIYVYLTIFLIILFFVIFVLFFNYQQKRKTFEKVYRKLSDSDKQVFHVI